MAEKTKRINIRLTEEHTKILQRMHETGIQNMSAYILRMALCGYHISMQWPELKEVLRLQSIISNNMNQCAREAHASGNIYLEDIEELKKLVKEESAILGEILKSLMCLYEL